MLYLLFICVNNNLKFYQMGLSSLTAQVTLSFLLFLSKQILRCYFCEIKLLPTYAELHHGEGGRC